MWRVLLIAACLAGPAVAQEDDRDYLTAFLEDTLSDAGRTVTVTGFAGALSSQATIESLTIADDDGVWLTLNGVVLDWSRSALLSGELTISQLAAAEVIVARMPKPDASALPSPEAAGFSLPELPVSVTIDRIAAARIELAPVVLGQPVVGTLEAALTLADGAGTANLDLRRTGEGPKGAIRLTASYSNISRDLAVDFAAEEDAGGIVVGLLNAPGAPSAALTVTGQGPIDDFEAEIRLATDGADRLFGIVALARDGEAYRLKSNLAGNLAPLIVPEYADFFGTEVALQLDARRSDAGRISVEAFGLSARSVSLSGQMELAADGLPEWVDVTGTLAAPDGTPVLLPFGTSETRISRADFALRSRQGDADSWSGSLLIDSLYHADLQADRIQLEGSGRIGRSAAGKSFGGTVSLVVDGLLPTDPDLARALGTSLEAKIRMHMLEGGGKLRLSDISLTGAGLAAMGALQIEGLDKAFLTSGQVELQANDFARFSGLAGRPLGGSGSLTVSGAASGLSGFVDADIAFDGTALSLDIPELDRLLAGRSTLVASFRRDENGVILRDFDLASGGLEAKGSGRLSSLGSDLSGTVRLSDLSQLGPQYSGALDLQGRFTGTTDDGQLLVTGSSQSLRVGNPEADKLLAGASALSLDLALKNGVLQIRDGRLANPQLSATVEGEIDGSLRKLVLDARLANLGLVLPDLTGPLQLSGTATQDSNGYQLDLTARGPGQIAAAVKGSIAIGFNVAALTITGTGQAGLANLFISPRSAAGLVGYDLRLAGPIALSSLSGRVTLSAGRIADPGLGLSFQGVEAIGQLRGGELALAATSDLSSGGRLRIDGPIRLAAPNDARLSIVLDQVRLYDPELYETRVDGSLALQGPLTGGAQVSGSLRLSGTEVRVPASGLASATTLTDIRHLTEPEAVRDTRRKAGLLGETTNGPGSQGTSRPLALNLTISAPSKVFIRGRGIDAELGGELRLGGTTANVIPSGAFRLIRGRMDILGKRLVLTRADLTLEGSLVPEISIAANTESDGVVSTVTIEGPANDPLVSFASSPELPQEEVLARLLFGRGLDSISALQAAQLANAVAVLAGRSAEGLIGKLRRNFGLDDLDVTTAEDGSTALKAGKYISENVYTEVEIGQDGKSRINLNLDLRDGITVKGRVGADGETGIGVYIERDY